MIEQEEEHMENDGEQNEGLDEGLAKSIKWPDVPRLCFGPGPEGHLNACVGWMQSRPNELDGYLEGYRRAAMVLFASAIANNTSPDLVVFPLAFLWRHHIELSLKDAIATGRLLEDKDWSFPDGHKLWDLWMTAKPYIHRCGPKNAPELKNAEANIKEFEKIDPYADGFRYPLNKDRSARSMPNAPEYVNIRLLQDAMEALGNFFHGVRAELSSQLEYKQDWEAERRQEMEAEYRRSYGE
jgi:hypothetical protein